MRKSLLLLSFFFIASPALASDAMELSCDRYALYAGLIMGFYMLVSWFLFGRDPEKETVVPQFNGLPDLTPAQAGWIYSYGQTPDECLIASLLQNNISGFCAMQEKDIPSSALLGGLVTNWGNTVNPMNMKDYSRNIKITQLRNALNEEEDFFEQALSFPLNLEYRYSRNFVRFFSDFKRFMRQCTENKYFTFNRLYLFIGCLLQVVLTYRFLSFSANYSLTILFTIPFLISCISAERSFFSSASLGKFPFKMIGSLLSAALFLFLMSGFLQHPETDPAILFCLFSGIAMAVYAHLIIVPTEEGMRVITHLDGIKMFLKDDSLAVGTDLNRMEELLPYAVVLGAEKEWISKMSSFSAGGMYAPDWNSGDEFSMDQLKNLHKIISVLCTRPRHRRGF